LNQQNSILNVFSNLKQGYTVIDKYFISGTEAVFKCSCRGKISIVCVVAYESYLLGQSANSFSSTELINTYFEKCEQYIRLKYDVDYNYDFMRNARFDMLNAVDGKIYMLLEVEESALKPLVIRPKRKKALGIIVLSAAVTAVIAAASFAVLYFLGNSTKSIIIEQSSKDKWYVGDVFTEDDIFLKVIDYLGRERIIYDGFNAETRKFEHSGEHYVKVVYKDKTEILTLYVEDIPKTEDVPAVNPTVETPETMPPEAPSIVSVYLKSPPSKSVYFINEELNMSGILLLIEYSDGSTETVTEGFTCSPTQLTSAGTQKITVSYDNGNL